MIEEDPVRLQKYLSMCGLGSRRSCESMISEGRVKLNGITVIEPGTKVFPDDTVALDNRIVEPKERRYFILNKPAGTISVNKDDRGRKWVVDLIPEGRELGLFPVGRLDLDTTGLMILTNDGDLANRISHPRYGVSKEYRAFVKGTWSMKSLKNAFREGVILENGEEVRDIQVVGVKPEEDGTEATIRIHEGRKHVVKRIFLSIGSRVYKLERISIGGLHLGDLKQGENRELTLKEIESSIENVTDT